MLVVVGEVEEEKVWFVDKETWKVEPAKLAFLTRKEGTRPSLSLRKAQR